MTPKITSKPIIDGIKTFHGLKLLAVGIAAGGGSSDERGVTATGTTCGMSEGGVIGRVTRRRTKVSSSASSNNSSAGGATGLPVVGAAAAAVSIPAATVKSSTNSPTAL